MLPAQIPAPAPEIQAVGQALNDLVKDLMAKKSISEISQDILKDVMGALQGLQNIVADAKKPEDQAYLGYAILEAVEAKPAVSPAA